jgi:hypothetical protein
MISGWRANDPSAIAPEDGGASAAVPAIQSFGLGALPSGGPETVHPSNVSPSSSNDVVPSPVETTTSSTNAPRAGNASSLAYEIDTSTSPPAYADRSIDHCS